jgi:hypothetical protein
MGERHIIRYFLSKGLAAKQIAYTLTPVPKPLFHMASVATGLGRSVALRHRASTLCHIRDHIRCLYICS